MVVKRTYGCKANIEQESEHRTGKKILGRKEKMDKKPGEIKASLEQKTLR